MNEKDFKYFRIIGKIQSCIASSKTFDEAVTACLKTVLENSMADCAVIWRACGTDTKVLRPVYWICPIDLSSRSCASGSGLVGGVFKNQSVKTLFDFKNEADDELKDTFSSLDVASLTCIPLNSGESCYGCVQFIKTSESGPFTQDEVDTCELLAAMAQLEIEAEAPAENLIPRGKVLMSAANIHKYFQSGETRSHVLKGVNLEVYEGEFLCLVGESGCGKSTMLNIIGGLLDFDDGSVVFDGRDISKFTQNELTEYRREHIGFVFQSYNLMPNLNAAQNIDLIGELVKDPADSGELLGLVGLAEKADRYPAQLSGGQQQRIAIARALVKKPKLILADEPTAALDYETSKDVLSVLENVVKKGTTLVLVTHNEEIAKMADRVIRFRDGKTYEVRVNTHPLHASDLVW